MQKQYHHIHPQINKYPTLNVEMKDCCCYTCGSGSIETVEIEGTYREEKTLKPFTKYVRYTWNSLNDYDEAKHFENVAWTIDGSLVAKDEDSEEEVTKEEYEEFKKEEKELINARS